MVVEIVFIVLSVFFDEMFNVFYKTVYFINFVLLKKGSGGFSLMFIAYLLLFCKYK